MVCSAPRLTCSTAAGLGKYVQRKADVEGGKLSFTILAVITSPDLRAVSGQIAYDLKGR